MTRDSPTRYPTAPLWRRMGALMVDCLPAWIAGTLVGGGFLGFFILFAVVWAGLRIAVVHAYQGQSLGRWSFNLRLAEVAKGRSPSALKVAKREGIVGLAATLAAYGMVQLIPTGGGSIVLTLPLIADCAIAGLDRDKQQAFHDRIARTVVVKSRRGYGLDRKFPNWWIQIRKWFVELGKDVE